jgi:hypothetical protein
MSVLNVAKFITESITISATSGGASGNVLYTCPANHDGLVRFLHLTNGSTNNKKVSIQIYHAANTQYHNLVNDLAMDANSIVDIIPGGSLLHLNAGDKLVCHMESGGNFDVTTSVEEHYEPNKSS